YLRSIGVNPENFYRSADRIEALSKTYNRKFTLKDLISTLRYLKYPIKIVRVPYQPFLYIYPNTFRVSRDIVIVLL
ncbi:MAG: hypothetical protein N3C61_03325, partial [Candidatus Micrarchaeota archaeon]|nr:hypothetical protein [Candidatus Micrarchaeota archaeon]